MWNRGDCWPIDEEFFFFFFFKISLGMGGESWGGFRYKWEREYRDTRVLSVLSVRVGYKNELSDRRLKREGGYKSRDVLGGVWWLPLKWLLCLVFPGTIFDVTNPDPNISRNPNGFILPCRVLAVFVYISPFCRCLAPCQSSEIPLLPWCDTNFFVQPYSVRSKLGVS